MLEKIVKEQEAKDGPLGFLGELLLERGLVSRDDLVAALEEVTLFRLLTPALPLSRRRCWNAFRTKLQFGIVSCR